MKLLFVCAGNICRSPMAEALFREAAPNANVVLIGDLAGMPGLEVDDPYGGPPERYRETAAHLERLVAAIAARLADERAPGR